jgi:hypothetical protein
VAQKALGIKAKEAEAIAVFLRKALLFCGDIVFVLYKERRINKEYN